METCREERRGEEAPDPLHTGRFIPVIIYDAHYLLGHPNILKFFILGAGGTLRRSLHNRKVNVKMAPPSPQAFSPLHRHQK